MQVVQQEKILDEQTASKLLKIVSNEQAMKILKHVIEYPQSAYDIGKATGIPLTQVYRWLHKLQNIGLLKITGTTNPAGKKFFMYQSKVISLKISLGLGPDVVLEIS